MGAWSLYFLAKLGLHAAGMIRLDWLANLLFALALCWPPPPRWRRARPVVVLPLAVALLYHDSFLPAPLRLLTQVAALSQFSPTYLWELAQRVFSPSLVLGLFGLTGAYLLLHRRLRFATFAVLGLLAVPLWPTGAPTPAAVSRNLPLDAAAAAPLTLERLESTLDGFHAAERGRSVVFPAGAAPAFDVIVLSVCSLSWDDLDTAKLRDAPLLSRFDVLFRQFNAAASYSGPAVLRLLNASCGQVPQRELYGLRPEGCHLFSQLAQAGWKPSLLLNHDGRFDQFAQQLRTQGGLNVAPEDASRAPVAMQAFDGSPVHTDYELLAQWWRTRAADPGHYALLYNTITLHDGNRVPGLKSLRSTDTWKPRATKLLDDLSRFLDLLQASDRPVVVVLIPEHGAALRGDLVQVSGLREIPTPAITHVPAAVKLVNFPGLASGGAPVVVERESSFLALATLLAQLAQANVGLLGHDSLQAMAQALPGTDWVSENEGTVMLRRAGQLYLRPSDGQWTEFNAGR